MEKLKPPYRLASTRRHRFLYALAERINSEEQRNQRKHPAGYGDEIVVLHATTFFRIAESGWPSRKSS